MADIPLAWPLHWVREVIIYYPSKRGVGWWSCIMVMLTHVLPTCFAHFWRLLIKLRSTPLSNDPPQALPYPLRTSSCSTRSQPETQRSLYFSLIVDLGVMVPVKEIETRKVKQSAHHHTASKWRSWNLNPVTGLYKTKQESDIHCGVAVCLADTTHFMHPSPLVVVNLMLESYHKKQGLR